LLKHKRRKRAEGIMRLKPWNLLGIWLIICGWCITFNTVNTYVSWLSADETANEEASCGLHSMDVIGFLWYSKCATTASPSYPKITMHFHIIFNNKGKIVADEIRQYESFFQNLVHVMIVRHQVHLEDL
jgi:uncharacterized CHY-type Zn-finger protein